MKKIAALLTLAGALVFAPAFAATPSGVRYAVVPEVADGRLTGLAVSVDLPTRTGQTYVLKVPEDLAEAGGPVFSIGGGSWVAGDRPQDRKLTLVAQASQVTIRYRLAATSEADMRARNQQTMVRAAGFSVRGEDLFVVPQGVDRLAATVTVGSPPGWTTASSLHGPTTVARLGDSHVLGGAGYRTATRKVDGVAFRLVYPESFAPRADALLDAAATIMTTERRFWTTSPKPVFIGLVESRDDAGYSGRGLQDGFMLYLGRNADQKGVVRLIAHENLHSWISRAIGGFPAKDDDLEAWLHEGFTEAYTARLLLRSGLWTMQDYIDDWNAALVHYGTSPVKTEPNTRILADRQKDFDVNKLPYDRGRLLAVKWDRQFRQKTKGRLGLDDVLRAQIGEAARLERAGRTASADALFPVVARRLTGVDLTSDLYRYVTWGQALTLSKDDFGPCIDVFQVTQPKFDRGFDLDASFDQRRVVGLAPGGPAERAGLRVGDRIRIDEIPTNDSRVTLSYQVDDGDGRSHWVRYRPEGEGTVTFQQLALRPSAAAACLPASP